MATFTCACNAGYTGATCNTVCNGRGTLDNHSNCQCATGWTGPLCDICDFAYSGKNCGIVCNGAGTLSWDDSGASCTCNTGFTGTVCQQCAHGYSGSNCSIMCNGKGNFTNGACVCDAEWEGQMCENSFSGHCYELIGTRHSWGSGHYNRFTCEVWRNGSSQNRINGEIHIAGLNRTTPYITNYGQIGATPPSWTWRASIRTPPLPPANLNATISCVIPAEPWSCDHCASTISPDPQWNNSRRVARGYNGSLVGRRCTAYDTGQTNGPYLTVAPALFADGKCKMCRSNSSSCDYGECSTSPPCTAGNCGSSILGEQCWPQSGTAEVYVSRVCPGNRANGLSYSPMHHGWFPPLDLS